jgi:hypothetical protein
MLAASCNAHGSTASPTRDPGLALCMKCACRTQHSTGKDLEQHSPSRAVNLTESAPQQVLAIEPRLVWVLFARSHATHLRLLVVREATCVAVHRCLLLLLVLPFVAAAAASGHGGRQQQRTGSFLSLEGLHRVSLTPLKSTVSMH